MTIENMLFCKRCGYSWRHQVQNPKCCPQCMSRKWNIERAGRRRSSVPSGKTQQSEQIFTDLETIQGLPLWYQALAEVLRQKGKLVITDEKPKSEA